MPTNALTTIDFHGAALVAIRGNTPAETLVAMKPVVEGMGLNWEKQRIKLNNHPVLAPTLRVAQVPGDDQAREHSFLPLKRLNFWLATVQPDRVPNLATRAKIIAYQTDCADVLFAHFFGKAMVSNVVEFSADHRSIIGGIAKSVLTKGLEPIANQLTELQIELRTAISGFDPGQAVVTDYEPMLAILKKLGVDKTARRALSQQCSGRMRRWCTNVGRGAAVRTSRETGRYLFHVDAAQDWLAAEGRAVISDHQARTIGQTALKLPPGRRKRRAAACKGAV
jgi:hypothetical protein